MKKKIFLVSVVVIIILLILPILYVMLHHTNKVETVRVTYNEGPRERGIAYNEYNSYSKGDALIGNTTDGLAIEMGEAYNDTDSVSEAPVASSDNGADSVLLKDKLIKKTFSYTFDTVSYDETINILLEAVNSSQGYVEYYNTYSADYNNSTLTETYSPREGYYQVRIPKSQIDYFQNKIATMVEDGSIIITSQSQSTEDVTEQHLDLETHIESLQKEYDTLNQLLEQATSVSEIIEVQDRLSDINYEITYYNDSLKALDTDIDYASYNITVDEVIYYQDTVERFTSDLAESWANTFEYWLSDILLQIILIGLSIIPIVAIIGIIVVLIIKYAIHESNKYNKVIKIEEKDDKVQEA